MDKLYIRDISFPVRVAITEEEHEKGLMFEKKAFPIAFWFKKPGIRQFWMKDTLVPLDILFCCDNRIIDITYGAPLSKKLIGPYKKSDLVIELPYGTVYNFGFSIDDKIDLELSEKTKSKIK